MTFNPEHITLSEVEAVNIYGEWKLALNIRESGCGLDFRVHSVEPWKPTTDELVHDTASTLYYGIKRKQGDATPLPQIPAWAEALSRTVLAAFEAAHRSNLIGVAKLRAERTRARASMRTALRAAVECGIDEDEVMEMVREAVVCNVIES